ncbi:MAG: dihydropteroate synthase [bacterium]
MKSKIFKNKKRPLIMGIVNVTPDSFYDGGKYIDPAVAVERAADMAVSGADILDVGGESTRPGAKEVDIELEKKRVLPVIEAIRAAGIKLPVSVDTTKAELAEQALEAGANIINDVSALRFDERMAAVVSENDAELVLMHMQGRPRDMQENPRYDDLIGEIILFLKQRIEFAESAGISREKIIVDPGIGFGKNLKHNREIFSKINRFSELDVSVLVGHSRKSYLGEVLNRPAEERLVGTLATSAYLQFKEVDIIRVHDVKEHVELRKTINWLKSGSG